MPSNASGLTLAMHAGPVSCIHVTTVIKQVASPRTVAELVELLTTLIEELVYCVLHRPCRIASDPNGTLRIYFDMGTVAECQACFVPHCVSIFHDLT